MSEGLTRNLNVPTHGCLMCTKCTRRHCPICYKCPEPVEIHKLGQIPVNAPVCDKCGLVFLECQCPAKGYGFLDRTITKEAQHALSRPNHTVEALDALRSAVVAQTALLRSLSEQVRLGFEARAHIFRGMEAGITKLVTELPEAFAGLAERLEKLEAQIVTYDTNQTERAVTVSGRLSAMEAKLPAQSPNDKMFTQCCERSKKRYWCSLPNGHKGQHIAKGTEGEIFEKWARRKAKR